MNDILSVLAWLAGPGLAVISAFILERLDPVQELSPTGKAIVAVSVAGLIGVLAVALQQAIGSDSELIARLQPYVNIIVPLVSLLAQQLAHGAAKAHRVKVSLQRIVIGSDVSESESELRSEFGVE